MSVLEKFLKKSDPKKYEKTVKKIDDKMPHLNKKPPARKRFIVQTKFSLYFKIRTNKNHAAKPLAFSHQFRFRHDQNHHSKLTLTIMNKCEKILKRQRPNTIKIF